jgi:uncharacterized membrane protein
MSVFAYGFALILIVAGIYHFVNPTVYYAFMPDWFPKQLANWAGGAAEIVIGLLMLLPATRVVGLYAAALLMLVFLPLHVFDLLRERPMIGSKAIAIVRLVLQFGLIYWLYREASHLA